MAKKTFHMSLSKKSIASCIKWLEEYSKSLEGKTQQFVDRLLELGITIAYAKSYESGTYGSHQMEDLVSFQKEVDQEKYGCKAILIGTGSTFISEWDNGTKQAEVYPLHMLEYGTGAFYIGDESMRMASLHSNDVAWYFLTNEGEWKLGTAIKPTQPMFNAYLDMRLEIVNVARSIFSK